MVETTLPPSCWHFDQAEALGSVLFDFVVVTVLAVVVVVFFVVEVVVFLAAVFAFAVVVTVVLCGDVSSRHSSWSFVD